MRAYRDVCVKHLIEETVRLVAVKKAHGGACLKGKRVEHRARRLREEGGSNAGERSDGDIIHLTVRFLTSPSLFDYTSAKQFEGKTTK